MTQHEPEAVPLRNRTIMEIEVGPDSWLAVEHVYEPEGAEACCACGGPAHDPGRVALSLTQGNEVLTALLPPAIALLVADRLTRGANLALESEEDNPDLEREVSRFVLDVPPQAGATE